MSIKRNELKERPDTLPSITWQVPTGQGRAYITVSYDEEDKPFEVFGIIGHSGTDVKEVIEGICRLASLALRSDIPIEEVIGQLKGIKSSQPVWYNGVEILGIVDAVGQVLELASNKEG
tara:strand:- start:352 stop:708 length:357 start_codon:yes stop_codon:yes gene_type:complete